MNKKYLQLRTPFSKKDVWLPNYENWTKEEMRLVTMSVLRHGDAYNFERAGLGHA